MIEASGRAAATIARTDNGDIRTYADYWSVSSGMTLLGDRWSLLIVRELLVGEYGFNDLSRSLPNLSRTLLSQRLKRLAQLGIVTRSEKTSSPNHRRYQLTPKGYALRQTIDALGIWASRWQRPSEHDLRIGLATLLHQMCQAIVTEKLPCASLKVGFAFGFEGLSIHGWLSSHQGRTASGLGKVPQSDLEVHVAPRVLYELWWGIRHCQEARQKGDIGFVGPSGWDEEFSQWFIPSDKSAQSGHFAASL